MMPEAAVPFPVTKDKCAYYMKSTKVRVWPSFHMANIRAVQKPTEVKSSMMIRESKTPKTFC